MDIFSHVLCKENIKLEPKYINGNFKSTLKNKLVTKLEGICSKHGFIKPNSIEITKISPGAIELISLAGYVVYDISFYADICNPLVGIIVKVAVTNINRFGILAEAGKLDNGKNVLEIIIPKNSVNIQSDVDLESCQIGDEIQVEIIRKKYELGDKKICAIGRVIKDPTVLSKREKAKLMAEDIDSDADPEIEVDDEIVEEEEEAEEEEIEAEEELEEEIEVESKHGGSDFFSDEGSLFEDDLEEDFDDDLDKDAGSVNEDD